MNAVTDRTIRALYLSVRDETEPMINDVQREAVRMLSWLAADGSDEARRALVNLARAPDLHPLLRELIAENLRALENA
jgi:hypothetical protein